MTNQPSSSELAPMLLPEIYIQLAVERANYYRYHGDERGSDQLITDCVAEILTRRVC